MTDRELLRIVRNAIELGGVSLYRAAEAIDARLAQPEPAPTNNGRYLTGYKAQPEPEPVAWIDWDEEGWAFLTTESCGVPLYRAPPQREWQGLTDEEEILELSKDAWGRDKLSQGRKDHTGFYIAFGRAIEAKLKEKNSAPD